MLVIRLSAPRYFPDGGFALFLLYSKSDDDLPKLVVPIGGVGSALLIAGVSLYARLRAVFNMRVEIESTPVAFHWSPT